MNSSREADYRFGASTTNCCLLSTVDFLYLSSAFSTNSLILTASLVCDYKLDMVMMGIDKVVVSLKSKIRSLKMKKVYDKIEKSDSMRVEIRSKKAKKIIEKTLRIADSPKTRTYAF
ncbi:hypothetical protein K2173_020028 [Erythroxylum novogranatense]|uniref:Uncharacterized protein n=1 Tax=Erythroxylum novogranatense TaxID=1862640 RepID=A0AAV8UA49_9ROSI|nr:hypothetical protein K2173_020028 [Erythroxylum novogranatense]